MGDKVAEEEVSSTTVPENNDPFRAFPQYARITIDVVFPGEYRIGWEYNKHQAVPATPRYFPFAEAVAYALAWFKNSFPGEARE